VLQRGSVLCSVLQCVAVCCGGSFKYVGLYCFRLSFVDMVCCSVLQCVAVCCSVLRRLFRARRALLFAYVVIGVVCCSVLQCVAKCCRVLQCVAVCCSVLQSVAVCCDGSFECIGLYCLHMSL